MAFDDKDDSAEFFVLVNDEEQYSLWPRNIPVPRGWTIVKAGTRAACGAYVNDVWTDMRPLRLRRNMEALEAQPSPGD